jgi:hypothetical protein
MYVLLLLLLASDPIVVVVCGSVLLFRFRLFRQTLEVNLFFVRLGLVLGSGLVFSLPIYFLLTSLTRGKRVE